MTVETIKGLIEHLPPDDQAVLANWIVMRDKLVWDGEIERDFSPGGPGMTLLEEIDALIDGGDVEGFRVSRPRN